MNEAIFHAINGWVGTFPFLDQVVLHMSTNILFKGVPIMMIFWWFWGIDDDRRIERRIELLALILVTSFSIMVTRELVEKLPFNARPFFTEGLQMNMPAGFDASTLNEASSFPSDHATMFFAIATGMWRVSRVGGAISLVLAFFFGAWTRVYYGFHWPADVFVGAMIGIVPAIFLLDLAIWFLQQVDAKRWLKEIPQVIYPVIFFITMEIATVFQSVEWFLEAVETALKQLG